MENNTVDTVMTYGQTLDFLMQGHKTALEAQEHQANQEKLRKLQERAENAGLEDVDNLTLESLETAHTRMKRKQSLTDEEKEDLLAKFDAGEGGSTELAKLFNVPQPYVSSFLKANDRVVKKGRAKGSVVIRNREEGQEAAASNKVLNEEQKAEILKLYDAGNGIGSTAIAKEIGMPQPLVSAYIKEQGFTLRKGPRASTEPKAPKVFKTPDQYKPRGKARTTRTELSPDEIEEVVKLFNAKEAGMVALATKYNVQPPYMKKVLEAAGCVIKKGPGPRKVLLEGSNEQEHPLGEATAGTGTLANTV